MSTRLRSKPIVAKSIAKCKKADQGCLSLGMVPFQSLNPLKICFLFRRHQRRARRGGRSTNQRPEGGDWIQDWNDRGCLRHRLHRGGLRDRTHRGVSVSKVADDVTPFVSKLICVILDKIPTDNTQGDMQVGNVYHAPGFLSSGVGSFGWCVPRHRWVDRM